MPANNISERVEEYHAELVELETRENGKPKFQSEKRHHERGVHHAADNRVHRVAKTIETGIMCINRTRSRQGLPFGGHKRSGIGRKKGLEETMKEYV